MASMFVRIVLSPSTAGWILGKFARELAHHLGELGVGVDCAPEPSSKADVHHWIHYLYYKPTWTRPINTLMITHVDGPAQLRHAQRSMGVVQAGICISSAMVAELAAHGVDRNKLCAVIPAHDAVMEPRRIVIGITTRRYDDGRKREDKLLDAARRMSLSRFRFDIIGAGWEPIIPQLERAGATVRYSPGTSDMRQDYEVNREWVPNFDYYLYLGEDEGSMGFLDALAAGVPTIVTPQGFHLDVPGGIAHAFWTAADLARVLETIQADRDRLWRSVSELTWRNYAENHLRVWEAITRGDAPSMARSPGADSAIGRSSEVIEMPSRKRAARAFDFWLRPAVSRMRRRAAQLLGHPYYGR